MRPSWTAVGFPASCAIFAIYWILTSASTPRPHYGHTTTRFVEFAINHAVADTTGQYKYLGNAAAALGVFHLLNPPLLITSVGIDRFHASETQFWRSDWRYCVQALLVSFWWWWLLGRITEGRGHPRVTLLHLALGVPLLCAVTSLSLYRFGWVRQPRGLTGFADALPVISGVSLLLAVAWTWRHGLSRVNVAVSGAAAIAIIFLFLWPPLVRSSWEEGNPRPSYSFVGHGWFRKHVEPSKGFHSQRLTHYRFHVARNLFVSEALIAIAATLASFGGRPPNMPLQRTRSRALLGRSPLNGGSLGAP
jgi:hypothetical protein